MLAWFSAMLTVMSDKVLAQRRRGKPQALLLLIFIGLGVYLNSLSAAFVFDDRYSIVSNPRIRHLWPIGPVLSATTRPLVMLSFAVNYALEGLAVWGYHDVNIAIHLLAALVLFGIVRRTLLSPSLRERYGAAA